MIKKINIIYLTAIIAVIILACGCKKDSDDKTFNIFSVQDDIDFGNQLKQEIESNPDYNVLDSITFLDAYKHIYQIRDSILTYGDLIYKDRFTWEIDIINDDDVLNAFCAPGGYICVYTGILKFLDNEAQFAGVLGHEMAHADRRHATDQLTKAYGIQILISILLGNNPNQLATIAAELAAGAAGLEFSRNAEYEADEYSVKYLYGSAYDARGVGGFFEKIEGSTGPEFLSTHPSPDNRQEKIIEWWEKLGSKEGEWFTDRYEAFKLTLEPQ